MKTYLSLIIFVVALSATTLAQSSKDLVEVYYFHRTTRCQTCMAIEKITGELLNEEYKAELKSEKIRFVSVDYQSDTTHPMVVKYKVEDPTLLILFTKKDKITSFDLTEEAFEYALSNPPALRKRISEQINELFR